MLVAIGYGISVFIGLVAGVIVQITVDSVKEKANLKNEINNLKFEIKCNIRKIDAWLTIVTDLRNKHNSGRILEFNKYLDLSSAIFVTYAKLLSNGMLYKVMNYEDIEKMQNICKPLSIMGENFFNNQINDFKQKMIILTNLVQHSYNTRTRAPIISGHCS